MTYKLRILHKNVSIKIIKPIFNTLTFKNYSNESNDCLGFLQIGSVNSKFLI